MNCKIVSTPISEPLPHSPAAQLVPKLRPSTSEPVSYTRASEPYPDGGKPLAKRSLPIWSESASSIRATARKSMMAPQAASVFLAYCAGLGDKRLLTEGDGDCARRFVRRWASVRPLTRSVP